MISLRVPTIEDVDWPDVGWGSRCWMSLGTLHTSDGCEISQLKLLSFFDVDALVGVNVMSNSSSWNVLCSNIVLEGNEM